MKKGFANSALILIIFCSVVVFFVVCAISIPLAGKGVFWFAETAEPGLSSSKNQKTQTNDESSNWKTYTNSTFKFSLQYPESLTKAPVVYEGVGGTIFREVINAPGNSYSITIYSYPKQFEATTKPSFNAVTESETTTTVADQIVKKLTGKEVISNKGTLVHVGPVIDGVQQYMFIYSSGALVAKPKDIDLFNQILSTFKFTE